jgi:uncharacterized protein (DUF58 family)
MFYKHIENDKQKIPKKLFKKIKKIEIRTKHLVTEAMTGSYNSIFRGYGMEFQEVREYTPGDDYRIIDWNVTAKHSIPYVKQFREERQLNVMLLIDASGSLEYGSSDSTKSEKLIETAAVLAFMALTNQDKIGAIFFTKEIEKIILPSKTKNSILRLIREILFIKPKNKGTNINIAIDYAINTMKRKGIIFILSDFISEINYKKIYIASKKHDIIPVVFTDNFEEKAINIGLVDMIDNETGELVLVDTASKFYKNSIKMRKNKKDNFFNSLKKLNIEPLIINTDKDVEKSIISYFEKRIKKIKI